ncbi:MAG: aquaporin family protein [Thaumarchaeota archaeon]|jgi:glycerol uptake facilitator protein|nr:aquaporin family protein [Nitrososphaerota archaeon]
MERPLSSALIAEAYGTFVLTLLGPTAITIVANYHNLFPAGAGLGLGFIGLAHGVGILIGIATVAQVSGAHFNPAVTIGLSAAGKFPKSRIAPYIAAQLVGAVIAAVVQFGMVGIDAAKSADLGSTLPNLNLPFPVFASLLAEIVGTMILVMTVLGSTDKSNNLPWSASSIGLSIAAVIWSLGAISGASLNPARSFGPAIVSLVFSTTPISWYWLYVVGPILGALVAAMLFKAIFRGER